MALSNTSLDSWLKYYEENEDWDKHTELIRKSRSEKRQEPKIQGKRKKDYTGKNFEQRIPKMVLMSEKYREAFKGPKVVYDFLWANIIRGKMLSDKLDIKRKYYDKGMLACSYPIDVIAEKLSMSPNTVRRYIDAIRKAGFIKIDKVKIDEHRFQNVYMLGTWHFVDGVENEYLYLQDECEN